MIAVPTRIQLSTSQSSIHYRLRSTPGPTPTPEPTNHSEPTAVPTITTKPSPAPTRTYKPTVSSAPTTTVSPTTKLQASKPPTASLDFASVATPDDPVTTVVSSQLHSKCLAVDLFGLAGAMFLFHGSGASVHEGVSGDLDAMSDGTCDVRLFISNLPQNVVPTS